MRCAAAKRLCSAILLTGALAAAGSARAQTQQERRWCDGEDGASPAQRIDGCSSVIKAARDKGEKLAESFTYREIGRAHV